MGSLVKSSHAMKTRYSVNSRRNPTQFEELGTWVLMLLPKNVYDGDLFVACEYV